MSKELFIKMREEEFLSLPDNTKAMLHDKVYSQSNNDHAENMKDALYAEYYNKKKEVGKKLDERQYQLREERRKQLKQS